MKRFQEGFYNDFMMINWQLYWILSKLVISTDYWLSSCLQTNEVTNTLLFIFAFVHIGSQKYLRVVVSVDLCRMERTRQTSALAQRRRNDAALQQDFFLGDLRHPANSEFKAPRRSSSAVYSHRAKTPRFLELPRHAGDNQRAATRFNWPANRYMVAHFKGRQEALWNLVQIRSRRRWPPAFEGKIRGDSAPLHSAFGLISQGTDLYRCCESNWEWSRARKQNYEDEQYSPPYKVGNRR